MSAHRQQRDTSLADWAGILTPDPGSGGNVAGDTVGVLGLAIGSGSENQMTLAVPTKLGLTLTVTVQSAGGGSRAMRQAGGTKLNVTGNNTITFSTVDHSIQLCSVPYLGASNASPTKCRWEIVFNDGPTLSTT